MLVCNPYEVVIHGTTSKGKIFRPSDWAERLCGILSSFTKDNRLSYSNWVRPIWWTMSVVWQSIKNWKKTIRKCSVS